MKKKPDITAEFTTSVYYNNKMKRLINLIRPTDILPYKKKFINKKMTVSGEDYYCLKNNFCFPQDEDINYVGAKLTYYEMEGNELFVTDKGFAGVLLKKSLSIIKSLRKQMIKEFQGVPFEIILVMDLKFGKGKSSAWIRFYKVRDKVHFISEEELNLWKQPVLISVLLYD